MHRVQLNCSCCDLYVVPAARAGQAIRYVLNGTKYRGQVALGRALGMSQTTVGTRIERRQCLLISTAEVMARVRAAHLRKYEEKDERPMQVLASKFVSVMGQAFPERGTVCRFPS